MAVSKKSLEALEKARVATQFSKDRQPDNPGRRPSVLARYIKDNGVSHQDIQLMIDSIVWGNNPSDIQLLLNDKESPPPIGVSIILGGLTEDLKTRSMENLGKLMDRAHGKAIQAIKTTPDNPNDIPETPEARAELAARLEKELREAKTKAEAE
jgi:hypothetical protein